MVAPKRIALYSHDTMGLGHVRRNILLSQILRNAYPEAAILLISGAREAGAFALPEGVDLVTLPAYEKRSDGSYGSRSLAVDVESLTNLRSRALSGVLDAFDPELLIIDKAPAGALGEALPALRSARDRGTVAVLGLRDILDDRETVAAEWSAGGYDALIADVYDSVWIYGDRSVFDFAKEYSLCPSTAAKLNYTGYLDQSLRTSLAESDASEDSGDMTLCLVGGGQDGEQLATAFARAEMLGGCRGVIVAGPYMPDDAFRRISQIIEGRSDMEALRFVETLPLIQKASKIVAMGGYNTVCEILSFGKEALVVPRVKPRLEQAIRAERLADAGFLDMMEPAALSSEALSAWLRKPANARPTARSVIEIDGQQRVPALVSECRKELASA